MVAPHLRALRGHRYALPKLHGGKRRDKAFLRRCAAPLPSLCPTCGFANGPAAKFCGGCGKPTGTAAATPPAAVSMPNGDPRIFDFPCRFPAAPSIRPENRDQGFDRKRLFDTGRTS
jgi:hypothetical protein